MHSEKASQQGHRLIQAGLALFLLWLIVGTLVQKFAIPRVALSVHLLGIVQGIFLMLLGILWPRITLSPGITALAFWLLLYGCVAAWAANAAAAAWGAGHALLPIAAGQTKGTELQETLIAFVLRSAAVSLIVAVILILFGLRRSRPRS